MGGQIVGDQDPLPRGIGLQDQLQELSEAGTVPPGAIQRNDRCGRGVECPQHPHASAAAVVRGEGGPSMTFLPYFTGIGLGTYGPEFVEADDPPCRAWLCIGLDDGPFFPQRLPRLSPRPSSTGASSTSLQPGATSRWSPGSHATHGAPGGSAVAGTACTRQKNGSDSAAWRAPAPPQYCNPSRHGGVGAQDWPHWPNLSARGD
jgi:hypothetical protein